MPRRPVIPSYRLHKPSGQAIVTLAGKMFYLGRFGTDDSRAAYDRLLSEWLARNRQAEPPAVTASSPEPLTVAELILRYWKHAGAYYTREGQPTGELNPLRSALRVLRRLYGRLAASEFSPLKLRAVREEMIRLGWARTTVNAQVKRLVRAFAWAVEQELIPAAVPVALREVRGLERGRTTAREPTAIQPVSEEVFQATLAWLPQVVADLLQLARLTGMRPGEACHLRPADLDQSGDIWLYTPQRHKTLHKGRSRVVAIGPRGQALLRPYLQRAPDDLCFSPAESERRRREALSARRVTPRAYGNGPGTNRKTKPKRRPGAAYSANSLRIAIVRACRRAGAPLWSPNQLRHSFATDVRARFGLEAAQVALGHAEADVTQVYAERDLAKAMQVMREVG